VGKTALITGVTGQDGTYLAKLLLGKGYTVHGTYHRPTFDKLDYFGIKADINLHHLELLEESSCRRAVEASQPDEIYHLAARTFVGDSFKAPVTWGNVNGLGTVRLLEASGSIPFYQASTSELFGNASPPQNESTLLHPRSPYGHSKLYAHEICRSYREQGRHVSTGILFNHESPLRGGEFVTQKIVRAVAAGRKLSLGNVNAYRDWGHAEDYVEAMWLMLQHPADNFVIATGKSHTVLEFLTRVEQIAGINVELSTDKSQIRPTEVDHLCGDASKARKILGWKPKHDLDSLIEDMLDAATISTVRTTQKRTAVGR